MLCVRRKRSQFLSLILSLFGFLGYSVFLNKRWNCDSEIVVRNESKEDEEMSLGFFFFSKSKNEKIVLCSMSW